MSKISRIISLLIRLGFNQTWVNLYSCGDGHQWWCGNQSVTAICQTGGDSEFFDWLPATFLTTIPYTTDTESTSTIPKIDSTSQSVITTSSSFSTATGNNIHGSRTEVATQTSSNISGIPSSMPTASSRNNYGRSQTTIAIGVGVGVPLSIMAMGGFGFLIWKERRRRPLYSGMARDPSSPPRSRQNIRSSDERHYEIDGNMAVPELSAQR